MFKNGLLNTIVLGVAIAIAGISIGVGFFKGRAGDRYVTVKGLAEREVNADLAVWPITFKVAENALGAVQSGIDESRQTITEFLMEAGLTEDQISYSAPKITDTQAERMYGNQSVSPYRYVAQATVTSRSSDVGLIKDTMERSGALVGKGIVLAEQSWQNPTEFLFTSLNDIKPEMIEEATKNAREAAEKFALDSGSKVGKIRNATQGYFSITDRDQNSPDVKSIRVVTTVQYFLVD
jgi:hypothetical protein